MDVIEKIKFRKSQPRLTEPGPDDSELKCLFDCACRAPDHALLKPWRFRVYRGEGRQKLADAFVPLARGQEPSISSEKILKLKNKPFRAPVVILASAKIVEHPKVPPIEQLLSTGAAVQNLLLAADALGYGAIWRTGSISYHKEMPSLLGLDDDEVIIGFIYLGSVDGKKLIAKEPDGRSFYEIIE